MGSNQDQCQRKLSGLVSALFIITMWSWNLFDLEGIPKSGSNVIISASFHIVHMPSYPPAEPLCAQATSLPPRLFYMHLSQYCLLFSIYVRSTYLLAKSSLPSQFTLIPSKFSEHRVPRKLFKMSSSLIPSSFHQFVDYVFNWCKLRCLQGTQEVRDVRWQEEGV